MCGSKNVNRGQQPAGTWNGPVFRHVIWHFIVNFSKEADRPFFMDWPKWSYSGTLTSLKTTEQVLQMAGSGGLVFVNREKSTGVPNCEDASCANYYAYDRKFPDTGYTSAYVEHEMHFGCRPILCTGDWQWEPEGISQIEFLDDLYSPSAPCDLGCLAGYEPPFGQGFTEVEFPLLFKDGWRTFSASEPSNGQNSDPDGNDSHHFSFEVDDNGNPIRLRTNLTNQPGWDDPFYHWQGGWASINYQYLQFGRIYTANGEGTTYGSSIPPLPSTYGRLPSAVAITDFHTYSTSGYAYQGLAPDWSSEDYQWYKNVSPRTAGPQARGEDCIRPTNPATTGDYTWEPLPFIPWLDEGRMFVDVVPMTRGDLQPYSVYLQYVIDLGVREKFISEHAEKVVSDVDGNQYLVTAPYEVQQTGKKDDRGAFIPNYDQLTGNFPRLRQTPVLPIDLNTLTQLSVEFTVTCSPGLSEAVCFNNFNVVLFPSEGINQVEKRIVFSDVEYLIQAHRNNDLVEISISIPYGVAFKEYTRTARVKCVDSGHCTFDLVDVQSHGQYRIDISNIVFQQ